MTKDTGGFKAGSIVGCISVHWNDHHKDTLDFAAQPSAIALFTLLLGRLWKSHPIHGTMTL
jgi:hypothetical protein